MPATAASWAEACLDQGREDLRAAASVGASVPSTVAMLLQMVFEKLAKAAFLRMETLSIDEAQRNHHVASRLIQTLRLDPSLLKTLGDGDATSWDRALPPVIELEDAHPARPLDPADPKGKRRLPRPMIEQLEYPWEDPVTHEVRWPARDLPIVERFADPLGTEVPHLLKFASALSKHHEALFPTP